MDETESVEHFHGDGPVAASQRVLVDRRELALVAVERTRMPMVITDPRQPDNPIVLANQAFLALTGYTADEVLGRNCRFLQGKDTSPAVVDEIRRAVHDERELEIEILNYRRDGSIFWNQFGLNPVHDDDGKLLYFFASQIDVTDLRRVQTAEQRLLREVDHRAGNALAIVNSIVRLSNADNPALYADAIQKRVEVLAQAHSLLAERGWQEVPLLDVIQERLKRHDPARVEFKGAPVMISARFVQPIALVVHEMDDNAVKHGALSVRDGTLNVSWVGSGDAGGFELSWHEKGRPTSPEKMRKGFGGAMIAGMVESQMRGHIEREWTADGLRATIRIPGEV